MQSLKARCAQYIGVPRLRGGLTPDGWDFCGAVRWIAIHELGLDWPSYQQAFARGVSYDDAGIASVVSRYLGEWRQIDKPGEGTVVCFDRRGRSAAPPPNIIHVGMALNQFEMLHVTGLAGTVVERFDSYVWHRYFAGAWERKSV